MKNYLLKSIALLFFFLVTFVCKPEVRTNNDQVRVIFETDIGNDIDDALALDMLYKYTDMGKINFLGVSSNKESPYSTEFIDIMNTWYGYPDLPIGRVINGANCSNDAIDYARKVCEMKNNDGNFIFKRSKSPYESIPESTDFYRRILSQQPDNSVCIISVGFSTNLSRLLSSTADKYSPMNGKDLVAKKVKSLVMMAGDFREKKVKEYNVFKDGPAARKVFAEWPTNIVTSPVDVGISILYPARIIEKNLLWTGGMHPLVEAYKSYLPMPYDRPTWDLTAVLYAIEPNSAYFNLSEPGVITVDENNFTIFTPDKKGKHVYLSVTPDQTKKIKQRFMDLTTQKPAFR